MIDDKIYQQTFKLLPVPTLILLPDSPRFTIIEVNDIYLEKGGLSRDSLIGKSYLDVFPDKQHPSYPNVGNLLEKVVQEKVANQTPVLKFDLPVRGTSYFETRYFVSSNTPVLNENNEVELIIRSVSDVTENMTFELKEKAVHTSLVNNEKLLSDTQRIARVGSWEADLIKESITWSDVVREIFEVSPDHQPTYGEPIDYYKEGENRDAFNAAIEETLTHGTSIDLELEIVTAKGNERWIRTTGKCEVKDGQCIRIYGAIQDINDRKLTEQQLIESRNQFQSLIQTVDGVVWEADAKTFEFFFVSDQVTNILGYTPEAWLKEPDFWQNHIHPDDREQAVGYCQLMTRNVRNHTFDYRMIRADGATVWIKDVVSVISEDGEPLWLRGIMMDITETKRFEKLEQLEKKVLELNSRKESSFQEVLSVYMLGVEALFPQMICSIHQVKNNRLYNLSSPSLPLLYVEALENLEIGDNVGSCGTAAFLKKKVIVSDIANDIRWADYKHIALPFGLLACWSDPIMNAEDEVIATFGIYYREIKAPEEQELKVIERCASIVQVVIENRLNSDLLEETSLLMQQGQDLAHFGNWQWDIPNDLVTWSDELYQIYGLEKADFKATFSGYQELLHPGDRDRVRMLIQQLVETRREVEFEERIIRPTGELRHLKSWGKVKVDEQGMPVRLIGACLDITESKKIQEELLASESRLRSLVDAQTNYVIRTDLTGDYTYYNNKYEEDFGWFYQRDNFIGVNCLITVLPGHHARVRETVLNCISDPNKVYPVELDNVQKDGGIKSILWHFICLTDSSGEPSEIQCIGIDITELKMAEDALRISNERYEYVNKATNDAIYDWDIADDYFNWGEGFFRLFGNEPLAGTCRLADWLARVHPADTERVTESLNTSLREITNTNWIIDYQFRKADGNYAHVEENGCVVRDPEGKAVRMIGVLRDVTRQKQEEHRLKLFESVVTHTNDFVLIAESDPSHAFGLRILYANASFTKMTGYSLDEVVGKSPAILNGPDSSENDFNLVVNGMKSKKAMEIETIQYRKNGEKFWIRLSLNPVTDEKGTITHWVSIGHDVTERLNYIMAIEKQNQKLQDIAWMQSHVVRAPLARLMGLIDLIKNYQNSDIEKNELLNHILTSAYDLDEIIRDISQKTNQYT